MIDAFKRASAGRITAVIPYYAYGRSDKKDQPRVPITARLIADMITVAGADRVLTMDLHQGQIQGFFNIPVDELTAVHMLSNYFRHKHIEDPVVVTDLGFAKRARTFAELLDAPLAIIEKRRVGNLDRAELMNVIGEVRGKRAIIVDDEIDTAGTLVEIVRALEREGVTEIYACATHGVLTDPAIDRIARLEPARGRADRLRPAARAASASPRSRRCPVAPLIGEAIKRIHRGESVGALFSSEVVVHPGDAPLGGRRRGRRSTPATARRTTSRRRDPLAASGPGRRPMSLQLHRPDGEGGLEPDARGRRRLAHPAPVAALGHVARGRPAAGAEEPRDEPDRRGRARCCSGSAWRSLTFVVLVVGYGIGFWKAVAGLTRLEADRPGDLALYLHPAMRFLSKFVDSNDRELRRLQPFVDETNALEAEIEALSDEEIRAAFDELRDEIHEAAAPDEPSEDELHHPDLERRRELAKERRKRENERLQEALDDVLPEVFAMTREAMKRTLGMRHFDVQLIGGVVLHQGKISEMRTGEGKTLVAPLAAILNALAGRGVHVVTVNDYLARRDPQWMGPVFHFLGVSVGMITHDASYVFEPGYPTNDERLHQPAPGHARARRTPRTSPTARTTSSGSTTCATTWSSSSTSGSSASAASRSSTRSTTSSSTRRGRR